HRRLAARGSKLKVFYTNSSAEYHRGDTSLAHTNAEGTRDVPSGPSARVYHFAGTEHGLGVWPPTAEKTAAADPAEPPEHSQNLRNTIDYAPLLRACLVNLDRWVTEGSEPPPSRHPRLADSTAVPFEALHAVFDRIPGANYPRHPARPCRAREASGDPRPSIEERYRSRDGYLERVRRAAAALVAQRFMLEEDIELTVALAARAWDHWTA